LPPSAITSVGRSERAGSFRAVTAESSHGFVLRRVPAA